MAGLSAEVPGQLAVAGINHADRDSKPILTDREAKIAVVRDDDRCIDRPADLVGGAMQFTSVLFSSQCWWEAMNTASGTSFPRACTITGHAEVASWFAARPLGIGAVLTWHVPAE